METLLKIPRLHDKYIKEHGVHEFVKQCQEVVHRWTQKQQE
jgi:hypothetical protein